MELRGNLPNALASTMSSPKDPARVVADEFEASFVAEMLKYSGLNKTSETFGGGAGEDAFASLLTDAYAKALVDAGGIGISDSIYQSILARQAVAATQKETL